MPARAQTPDPNVGGLGFLLDRLSHSLTRSFESALAPFGLRSSHLGVLSAITRFGATSQSQLAAYLGLERQQMVHLVDRLEELGFVERRPAPEDRRRSRVAITAAGRRVRERAVIAAREHEAKAFAVLSPAEQRELSGLLLKLVPSGHFKTLFEPPA